MDWSDTHIIEAFERILKNDPEAFSRPDEIVYSVTQKELLAFSTFLLDWGRHKVCSLGTPTDEELAEIYASAAQDRNQVITSSSDKGTIVRFHAAMVRAIAQRLPVDSVQEVIKPSEGIAQRLRDLAAGKLTGEIKQFEYSFAADRIRELELQVEKLQAERLDSKKQGQ
jgi:ABC-type amino acid transport substrate-binding protein